jgi:hypothetical protein
LVKDPFAEPSNQEPVPNIMPGHYEDYGSNAGTILITVESDGPMEGLTRVYRHVTLLVDIWVSAGQSPNIDGRRIANILYEYVRRTLQEVNYSGQGCSIQRSYEISRSEVMFEPTNKVYHISNNYRVEAISQTWF